MLALLAEARDLWRAGGWPGARRRAGVRQLIGIETRPRRGGRWRNGRSAMTATIVAGDARAYAPDGCRAVLFFDVLHMMPRADQADLLQAMAHALEPDGVMLVREADAAAGRRFTAVRLGNRLKALLFGSWRQTFHFRTAEQWRQAFEQLGFHVQARGSGRGHAVRQRAVRPHSVTPRVCMNRPTWTIC